jgi:predicted homoserine dehydrogenase-like protein
VSHTPGLRVAVPSDPDIGKAKAALIAAGVSSDRIVQTHATDQAEDAIAQGKTIVTDDYAFAARLDSVDVVTDVTPSPASEAAVAYSAINIEADVTAGRYLKRPAADNGVLCSMSSGDEPGCLMELWDCVTALGYEPVVIGKGKNSPLQPDATPYTVAESERRAGKDAHQIASYVDGTKTMFEMACAANATGCLPMCRGMVGPTANLETVSQIFALQADGGITPSSPAVDFVQGSDMADGMVITVAKRTLDPGQTPDDFGGCRTTLKQPNTVHARSVS